MGIISRLKDLKHYIRIHWIRHTHAMVSNLPRGVWYDYEERLLHCAFDELVNFVEKESSLKDIEWASKLTMGEMGFDEEGNAVGEDHPRYNELTDQAVAAIGTLALYKWWKEERPKRLNPCEIEPHEHLKCIMIEEFYESEDTVMLVELVKIRSYLWT